MTKNEQYFKELHVELSQKVEYMEYSPKPPNFIKNLDYYLGLKKAIDTNKAIINRLNYKLVREPWTLHPESKSKVEQEIKNLIEENERFHWLLNRADGVLV